MKIKILTIGNTSDKNISALCKEYTKRVSRFSKIELFSYKELKNKNDRIAEETKLIKKKVKTRRVQHPFRHRRKKNGYIWF